jgi:hypothetical protein
MQLLEKACELLNTAEHLVSSREDENGTKEALVLDLPFVCGLFFGVLGTKKLIDGEPVGNTELEFINIMAANYAFMLDRLGVVRFEPHEQVMARLEAEGIVLNEMPATEQPGDDAS